MESFYVPPDLIANGHLTIRDEEHHHITRVLRMNAGDTLRVVDGKGTAYVCRITSVSSHETVCTIDATQPLYNEPSLHVSLMFPILKNHNRIEWLVEKGTELGVAGFIPVATFRTVSNRLRIGRLRKIAAAAMKQCKRSLLPEIREETDLETLLQNEARTFDVIYIGDEERTDILRLGVGRQNLSGKRVLLLTGPEGGFTEEETALSINHGAVPVTLGRRRLRAETAALIMAANIITD
jgi:16S rRNA (uracil1498-N3)-methyltransferase